MLEALVLYLLYEAPPEEQNFPMVMDMIAAAEVREEDETYQSPLDELFERLAMRDPEHLAVKQYNIFAVWTPSITSALMNCPASVISIRSLRSLIWARRSAT